MKYGINLALACIGDAAKIFGNQKTCSSKSILVQEYN